MLEDPKGYGLFEIDNDMNPQESHSNEICIESTERKGCCHSWGSNPSKIMQGVKIHESVQFTLYTMLCQWSFFVLSLVENLDSFLV